MKPVGSGFLDRNDCLAYSGEVARANTEGAMMVGFPLVRENFSALPDYFLLYGRFLADTLSRRISVSPLRPVAGAGLARYFFLLSPDELDGARCFFVQVAIA